MKAETVNDESPTFKKDLLGSNTMRMDSVIFTYSNELNGTIEHKESNGDNTLMYNSYNSDKSFFQKSKEEMWTGLKRDAVKKAHEEYNTCVTNKNSKVVCVIRKYLKFFFYLKTKSYNRFLNNYNLINVIKNPYAFIRNDSKDPSYYVKSISIPKSKTNLYQVIYNGLLGTLRSIKNAIYYSDKKDMSKVIETYLKFKDTNFEKMFLNCFYSALPFKICIFSTLMILMSCIQFFILYSCILYFVYDHFVLMMSIFKFLFDVFYFLSSILYIVVFNYGCIDNVGNYSYKSCYALVPITLGHSLLLLRVLSSIELNDLPVNKKFSQSSVVVMTNVYIGFMCFLSNYMIIYNFLWVLKLSSFCMICILLFLICCYLYQFDLTSLCLIFGLLSLEIVVSLWYEYNYERRWRLMFWSVYESKNTEQNNMTRYFSMYNLVPTSPIEDIMMNLKRLLELINQMENDVQGSHGDYINWIRENVHSCQNILKTKNLNEVQIYKYRKFERVYNLWCLDKLEKDINNGEEMTHSDVDASDVKETQTIFGGTGHIKLLTQFYEENKITYDWNIDIRQKYEDNIFITIGYKLLYPLGVIQLNVEKDHLKKFLLKIYSMYNEVPYHNSLHAAQVAHFSKSLLHLLQMNEKVTPLDEFCLHVAALCHDVGHPGLSNYFLINSENDLALTYNDTSVLENYHCSLIFKSLKNEKVNIFQNYPYSIFADCRKKIIRAILATDMKNHFEHISNFRATKELLDIDNLTIDQTWEIFCLVLKAADIGHSALKWELHFEWTMKINEEFYIQGLLEDSLHMKKSVLCDIGTMSQLANSQMDFLKHLCIPLFSELNSICPDSAVYTNCVQTIEENIEEWDKKKNDDENLGLREKYKDEQIDSLKQCITILQ